MHKVDPFFKRFAQPVVVGDERAALSSQMPLCITGEAANVAQHDRQGNSTDLVLHKRPRGGATREEAPSVVMEPIAMLRQCIRYFTSHPETYGTNLRALLDREVLHVMRLKASEMALVDSKPVYVSPEMRNCTTMLTHNAERDTATSTTGFLPSLPGSVTTARQGSQRTRDIRGRGRGNATTSTQSVNDGNTGETGLFGYGGVTFMQPTAGLLALLEPGVETRAGGNNARGELTAMGSPAVERLTTQLSVHESIAWDGNTNTTHGASDASRLGAMGGAGRTVLEPILSTAATSSDAKSQLVQLTASLSASPSSAAVVVDGGGYEVDFLRSQLQQLGAAYNAKCMRLHELTEENSRLLTQLKSADETKERWVQTCRTTQAQLERLKVELDAWKERVRDAAMQASTPAQHRGSQTQELIMSNQLQEVKQEVAKLTQLWRDTERALQESRRAFENADKEASHSHDHLSDAFHYIERLERRLMRREAYIALQTRRQASLEEKYEKLMWCFEELGTMAGTHSFADFLLHDSPVWSLVLFVRMQRHVGDYAPLSLMNAAPSGAQDATTTMMMMMGRSKNGGRAALLEGGEERDAGANAGRRRSGGDAVMQFRRSPGGGVLVDGTYDSWVVYNYIADDVTALRTRRLKGTRLRTNLHGTVACRVLRWCGPFAVDYLGGEDSLPDSCDLNRRKLPLLTLAALVLPLRAADGARLPSLTAASAMAPPPETTAEAPATANAAERNESNGSTTGVSAEAASSAIPAFDELIVNSREYDQASIRLLLRAFWQERLRQYTATMQRRVRKLAAQARRRQRQSARNNASSLASADGTTGPFGRFGSVTAESDGDAVLRDENEDDDVSSNDDEDDEDEDDMSSDTFLAALLRFVIRFTNEVASVDGGADSATTTTQFARYSVHGVLPKADKSLWDNGRAFFATIIGHNATSASGSKEAAAENISNNETSDVRLGTRARELLAALYYYVMEYKDHDADFRLFYLVSHQRIPEMVGVNFYASLEAFQADCFRAWQARLTSSAPTAGEGRTSATPTSRQGVADITSPSRPTSAMSFSRVSSFGTRMEDDTAGRGSAHRHDHALRTRTSVEEKEEERKFRTDQPLGALCTVVEMLDQAPLAAEEEEIEPDSEGEGYASILPGATQEVNATYTGASAGKGARHQNGNSASSGNNRQAEAAMHEEGNRSLSRTTASFSLTARPSNATSAGRQHSTSGANNSTSNNNGSGSSGGGVERRSTSGAHAHRSGPLTAPARRASMELVHNLREYLASLRVRRGGDVMGASEEVATHGQGEQRTEGQTTAATEQSQRLPSAWQALDMRIQAVLGTHHSLLRDYETAMVRKDLDMLKLPQSRARRARFMQVESAALAATRGLLPVTELMRLLHAHCFTTYAVTCCGAPRFSLAATLCATQTDGLDPLSAVGQVPPTEIHLRRLRFALALDQPASLIHFTRLFDLDGHVGNMTHLYDEYLTLTLDTFLQQQSYWMAAVLRACAARHERYAAEGAEDCDGKVPVSHLKHGFARTFAGLGGLGRAQAFAFVDHLCHYDELLRHESEVKLGQFTDAPFFVNSAGDARGGRSASKRGDSAATVGAGQGANEQNDDDEAAEEEEEEEEDDWDFQEEARGCSLLNLALAVRMSYIVWGSNVTESARRLMLLSSLPPYITSVYDDEALVTYHNHTIYGEDKTRDGAHRNSNSSSSNSYGGGNNERKEGTVMTVEQMRALHQDALQAFEEAVKVAYVHAATRLTHDTGYTAASNSTAATGGHRYSLNALRQTAYMLQPEVTRRRSERSVDHASDGANNTNAAATMGVSQRPSLLGLTALEAWGGAEAGAQSQHEGGSCGGAAGLLASRYPDYRSWLTQYTLPPSVLRALAVQQEATTTAVQQQQHRASSGATSAKSSSRAAKRRSGADEAVATTTRSAKKSTDASGETPRDAMGQGVMPGSPAAADATLYDLARLLGLRLSAETLLAASALAGAADKRGRGKHRGGKAKGGKKRKKGASDVAAAVPATRVAMSTMGSNGAAAMLAGLQSCMQAILTPHIAVAEQLSRAAESTTAERQTISTGGPPARTITSAASRESGGAARTKAQRTKSVVFTEQSEAGATASSGQERRTAGDDTETQREAMTTNGVGPRGWVLSMDGVDGAGGMERPVYGTAANTSTAPRESNVLHVQNLLAGCAALSIL